jgi:MarR family transcriptional regulator, lower aerobic nicotinate degradation pathway regulator
MRSVAASPRDTVASYQSLALLDHLSRVARREADGAPDPDGLRPRHLVALTLLRDHGAATQQALAEALRLDPSNLVGLLNDLESRGLVRRRRDPDDRRRHIVELASTGVTTLHAAEQRLGAVENKVLGALSADERCTLHALLIRAAGGQLPATACVESDST